MKITEREEQKAQKAGPDEAPQIFKANPERAGVCTQDQDAEADCSNAAADNDRSVRVDPVFCQMS